LKKLAFLIIFINFLYASDSLHVNFFTYPNVSYHQFNFDGIERLDDNSQLAEIKKRVSFNPDLFPTFGLTFRYKKMILSGSIEIPLENMGAGLFENYGDIINKNGKSRKFYNIIDLNNITPTKKTHQLDDLKDFSYQLQFLYEVKKHLNLGIHYYYSQNQIHDFIPFSPQGIFYADSLNFGTFSINRKSIGLNIAYMKKIHDFSFLMSGYFHFLGNYHIKYVKNIIKDLRYSSFFLGGDIKIYFKNFFVGYQYQFWRTKDNLFKDIYNNLFLGFQLEIVKMKFSYEEL